MNPTRRSAHGPETNLNIQEVRLISDLRIMHAKVDELHQVVTNLKHRHDEGDICKYADAPVLADDIARVDEIYLWFVKLKEERKNGGKKRA